MPVRRNELGLTDPQVAVLRSLWRHRKIAHVARDLQLAQVTVDKHLANARRILNAYDSMDAARRFAEFDARTGEAAAPYGISIPDDGVSIVADSAPNTDRSAVDPKRSRRPVSDLVRNKDGSVPLTMDCHPTGKEGREDRLSLRTALPKTAVEIMLMIFILAILITAAIALALFVEYLGFAPFRALNNLNVTPGG